MGSVVVGSVSPTLGAPCVSYPGWLPMTMTCFGMAVTCFSFRSAVVRTKCVHDPSRPVAATIVLSCSDTVGRVQYTRNR